MNSTQKIAALLCSGWVFGCGRQFPPVEHHVDVSQEQPEESGDVSQGVLAPDFELLSLSGEKTVRLRELIGQRPVVLIFGAYACSPFRRQMGAVNRLYEKFVNDVEFLLVYGREAHTEDGIQSAYNREDGVLFNQPKTFQERCLIALRFCEQQHVTMPVVVDDMKDSVTRAYDGFPARMYVIDGDGKIYFQSDWGPSGYMPTLLKAMIEELLEAVPSKRGGVSSLGVSVTSIGTLQLVRRVG